MNLSLLEISVYCAKPPKTLQRISNSHRYIDHKTLKKGLTDRFLLQDVQCFLILNERACIVIRWKLNVSWKKKIKSTLEYNLPVVKRVFLGVPVNMWDKIIYGAEVREKGTIGPLNPSLKVQYVAQYPDTSLKNCYNFPFSLQEFWNLALWYSI